ncbi:hypothetical protein RND81_03G211400 [Saponaria officinalis]|uniref:RING-type E3 ubiquitin transferase n=1 Tax=Saponaria officinalis TaxID=3572 RepID=A0AAW1M1Y6_SAPOF
MGAAVNGQYSRRMVTPMSGKANYVLHHAPDYCHIWFVCMYQLIYMRDRLSQPAVDSEYMDTLLDNINKLDQLLKISFSHPPICSPEVEAAHSPPWSSFTKRHAPKRHANLGLDLFEILYYEEYELRKTLEEKLAKGKEVIENIKRLWNVISPELHKSLDKQSLLESQIADSNAEVKELEEKIISAVDLLQKFKTKRDKYEMERDKALQENEGLKKLVAQEPSCSRFSYSELHKATNHFDRTLIIGEEGNGSTYKGFLCRTEVAIKMLNSSSILEYDQNVAILSKLRHPRVVTLIGVCPESCALVYEYLSGGSLGNRLFFKNDSPPLKWQTRIQIANDICSALIFIHSSQPNGSIIHGNLKPSNILLDDNFSVKLSDFGICHVIPDTETTSERIARLCTIVKNCTMIYIDPDFLLTGELTPKSDVYSFGIILLHLLTGINTLGIAKEVKYALRRDDLYSILDPSAGDWPFVQAQQIAHLALRCSDLDPENRPDLESDVWSVLQQMIVSGCGLSTTLKPSSEQAPDHFKCPISMEIMEDPHIASDGYTYEGKEIKKWLGSGRNTSPMTGLKLDNLVLIPNRSLRSAIQEWLQHPQTVS